MADFSSSNCDHDPASPRDHCQSVVDEIARRFERSLTLQKAVYRIANLACTADDIQSFYRQVHEIVDEITSAKNLFVALRDEETGTITFPYCVDGATGMNGATGQLPFEYAESGDARRLMISRLVLESGTLVHLSRDETPPLPADHTGTSAVGRVAEDWLGVPLLRGDRALGALVILSYERGFRYPRQDEVLMTCIGPHIANALQRISVTESLRQAHDQLKRKNAELEKGAEVFARTTANLKKLLHERKLIQKQLAHTASHDALTGLPNRSYLLTRLRSVIEAANSDPDLEYAILFLDLDRFKIVNDCLGHLVGDALLKEVSARLRTCVRPDDVVARLGGDEFCILLSAGATDEVIQRVASRILENLCQPVNLDSQRVVTSASIGVARGSLGYTDAEDLLRDADTALYQVKTNGKSGFRVFDRSMRERAVNRLKMEQALRLAVEENDIAVHYQPVVDIQTGQIVSFEALARWIHPDFGDVPASRFIAVAEEIHLISRLTASVLRISADQICQWRKEIPGLENLSLNVNISSRQIQNGDCIETVRRVLDRVNLPPENLKLEVTESLLLNNVEMATAVLHQLSQMKVRLALDDFGTGYSSLSCLNSLPLHELKIDLSFVRNIVTEPRSHAIVQMIVALAEVMNLKVVAEGIENEAQLQILRDLNVEYAQGYLFGQPASATAVTRMLVQISGRSSDVFINPGIMNTNPVNTLDYQSGT